MTVWKYITSTSKQTFNADRQEYKELCEQRKKARSACVTAKSELIVDLRYKFRENLPFRNCTGCIVIHAQEVPEFGRDNDGGVVISRHNCEFFSNVNKCQKTDCKFYSKYLEYFNAVHVCRALEKQCGIFWKQKFANAR